MIARSDRAAAAVVISPHPDDAVLSLGVCLCGYARVLVVDVFSRSSSHVLETALAPKEATAVRAQENASVERRYGFEFVSLGFSDSGLRGVDWANQEEPLDSTLASDVSASLCATLGKRSEILAAADVFIPAAIGIHPDHLATLAAVCEGEFREMLEAPWRVFLYAELPYAACPQRVSLRVHGWLTESAALVVKVCPEEKRSLLSCYPSQLTEERIAHLVGQPERCWGPFEPGHPIFERESLARMRAREGLFGMPEWLSLLDGIREEKEARFDVEVRTSRMRSIVVPLARAVHSVAGCDVSFVRHAACFSTDYLSYPRSWEHDDRSWGELVEQLRERNDIDALWLSCIREDTAARAAMARRKRGCLIDAVPSLGILCHPGGFDAWQASQPRTTRKKMCQCAHNERLLRKHAAEQGDALVLAVQRADAETIDTLLALQALRAERVATMDALGHDPCYRALFVGAAEKDLLHVVRVGVGARDVSLVLVRLEDDQHKILVLAQGFDPEFSARAPSFLAFRFLIEFAHEQGFWEVDFLRGDEAYKSLLCNKVTRMFKYVEPLSEEAMRLLPEIADFAANCEE